MPRPFLTSLLCWAALTLPNGLQASLDRGTGNFFTASARSICCVTTKSEREAHHSATTLAHTLPGSRVAAWAPGWVQAERTRLGSVLCSKQQVATGAQCPRRNWHNAGGQSGNRCSTTAQLSTRHVHAAISCAVALNVNACVQALGHRRRGAHNVCLEVGECRHSPHGRVNVDESIHAARKRQSADSWEGKDRASCKALIAEVCVEDGATSVTAAVAVAEQRRRVQKGGVSGACRWRCLAVRTLVSAGTGLWATGSTQGT